MDQTTQLKGTAKMSFFNNTQTQAGKKNSTLYIYIKKKKNKETE